MNQNASSLDSILQEILETPSTNNKCSCHIINPKVHRLILWADINKETNQTEYSLRIGSQRFTSLANIDKLGQTYWCFQAAGYYADGKETISENEKT